MIYVSLLVQCTVMCVCVCVCVQPITPPPACWRGRWPKRSRRVNRVGQTAFFTLWVTCTVVALHCMLLQKEKKDATKEAQTCCANSAIGLWRMYRWWKCVCVFSEKPVQLSDKILSQTFNCMFFWVTGPLPVSAPIRKSSPSWFWCPYFAEYCFCACCHAWNTHGYFNAVSHL